MFEGVLLSLAHHLCGDAAEAEELAQATFVEAFRSLDRLQDADRFGAWLQGICRNLHRRRMQERARQPEPLDLTHVDRRIPEPDAEGWLAGLGAAELFEIVSAEIQNLSEPVALVLTMRHHGGLSCKEIARRLDVPIGTVTMRLSRGHRRLREVLTRQLRLSEGDCP